MIELACAGVGQPRAYELACVRVGMCTSWHVYEPACVRVGAYELARVRVAFGTISVRKLRITSRA